MFEYGSNPFNLEDFDKYAVSTGFKLYEEKFQIDFPKYSEHL